MVEAQSRRSAALPIAVAATLGLAAPCWAAAAWLMDGMDMGVATRRARVLRRGVGDDDGGDDAAGRGARGGQACPEDRHGPVRAPLVFAGSYLAIWALAGGVAYALDRPHGPQVAGIVVIAAGAYELTPVKRHFRRRCREDTGPGPGFGLCCAASTAGLMAMLVALGVMSLFWMAVVAVLASAQKLLPATAEIDIPLALAIIGLGLVIVIAPALLPGLTPPPM